VNVLVTDGEQRASLSVVRSLGRTGYRVHVSSHERRSLAGASRFATATALVPSPLLAPAEYTDAIAELVRRRRVDVLLPVTEQSLLALLPARDRFAGVSVAAPPLDALRRISNKSELLVHADKQGIAVPRQAVLESPGTARDALGALSFPVVVKPARSIHEGGFFNVKHAAGAAELAARLAAFPPAAYPLIVQERIVGPGTGIFLLLWDGRLLATFAHRRLREMPPSGGVSVYSESIAADPALVAASRALLDDFGWHGVAMVEYKRDARTGTPYLMEINGRFWGSLQLAVDAGVDFPALLVAAALGQPVAPVERYRIGVRLRWAWGDLEHLITRMRHSPERLSLPPDAPPRGQVLREFLTWRRGDRNETLRLSDPLPFFVDARQWLGIRLGRS
jgi:predicted ATP-grasp superfamily ATP-dependent carboligase